MPWTWRPRNVPPSGQTSLSSSSPCMRLCKGCTPCRILKSGSGERSRPPTRPSYRTGPFGQTPPPVTAPRTRERPAAARTPQAEEPTRNELRRRPLRRANPCSTPHDGLNVTIWIRGKLPRVFTPPPIPAMATRPRPPPPESLGFATPYNVGFILPAWARVSIVHTYSRAYRRHYNRAPASSHPWRGPAPSHAIFSRGDHRRDHRCSKSTLR